MQEYTQKFFRIRSYMSYQAILCLCTTLVLTGLPRDANTQDTPLKPWIKIHYVRIEGYAGSIVKDTVIDSENLTETEAKEFLELLKKAQFFHLPRVITSKKQRCSDCGHIEITAETEHRQHTVVIELDRVNPPSSLQPLIDRIDPGIKDLLD